MLISVHHSRASRCEGRKYCLFMADPRNSRRGCGSLEGWGALLTGIAAVGGLLFAVVQYFSEEVEKPSESAVIESVDEETIEDLTEEASEGDAESPSDETNDLEEEVSSPEPESTTRENRTQSDSVEREASPPRPAAREDIVIPLPPPSPPPAPVPSRPSTAPTPSVPALPPVNIQTQRVSFPSGARVIRVANSVSLGTTRRYVVNARQGQILTVNTLEGTNSVSFVLRGPDGAIVPNAIGLARWQGFLPVGGDYSVDVTNQLMALNSEDFVLEIQLTAAIPAN